MMQISNGNQQWPGVPPLLPIGNFHIPRQPDMHANTANTITILGQPVSVAEDLPPVVEDGKE